MNRIKNIFLKIIFVYSIFATLLSLFLLINRNNLSAKMQDALIDTISLFVVSPMLVSIPILYLLYNFFKIKETLEQNNQIHIVNPDLKNKLSLKDICAINIIHNCVFLFNLGLSISLSLIEIIFIIAYFYLKNSKLPNVFYTITKFIKNYFSYIIFVIIFILSILATLLTLDIYITDKTSPGGLGMGSLIVFPLAIFPMIISTPILFLLYKSFNKKAIKSTDKKTYTLNIIFKNLCFLNLIHNFIFPFNLFYNIFLTVLEIVLIIIYCLNIIFKFNTKFKITNFIIKSILWIIFSIMTIVSLYLLSKLIVFWVLFIYEGL